MTRLSPVCGALMLASVIGASAGAVQAEEARSIQNGAVELRIGAVLASYTGNTFDNRLTSLRRPFDLFPYSSYRLLHEERRRVAWRREAEFRIPGGRYLIVIPREYKDGRVALSMMLIQRSKALVNTALALRDHGTFLVGGPNHRDGVLIIAIGAETVP